MGDQRMPRLRHTPGVLGDSTPTWEVPPSMLSPLSDHHCGTSQSDCGLRAALPAEGMDGVVVGHGQTTRRGAAVMPPPSET